MIETHKIKAVFLSVCDEMLKTDDEDVKITLNSPFHLLGISWI